MKIISWNVASLPALQGFIEHEKGSMRRFLEDLGVDIMCFQETKLTLAQVTKKQAPFLVPDGGWFTYWSIGQTPGYCGIATFCKVEPVAVYTDVELLGEEDEEGFEVSKEGRVLLTDHGDFVLFNVYCPNAGGEGRPRLEFKRKFLEALWKKMEEWRVGRRRRVVLVGDLNLVANMEEDMHREFWREKGLDERTRHWFPRVLEGGRYVDTFRELHPEETEVYSFFDNYITTRRGANQGYRIDYILVSSTPVETMPRIEKAEILGSGVLKSSKASDHVPVMVELGFGKEGGKEEEEKEDGKGGKQQQQQQQRQEEEEEEEEEHKQQQQQEEQAMPVRVPLSPPDVKGKVEGRVLFRKLLPDPNQPSIKGFFAKKATETTAMVMPGAGASTTAAAGGGAANGAAAAAEIGGKGAGGAAGAVAKRGAEEGKEEAAKGNKRARQPTTAEAKGLRKFFGSASSGSSSSSSGGSSSEKKEG